MHSNGVITIPAVMKVRIIRLFELLERLNQILVQFVFEPDHSLQIDKTVVLTHEKLVFVGVQIVSERKISNFKQLRTAANAISRVAIATCVLALQSVVVAAVE
jgi:hypothetical protein